MYEILYRHSVRNDLKKLPLSARRDATKTILSLAKKPYPGGCAKLSGLKNTYRIRRGVYRIVYSVENNQLVIIIIRVGHRKDVYKSL